MRFLGIDFGKKRVGIAISDESNSFAFAHSVLENDDDFLKKIFDLIEKESVSTVVVGESNNLDGAPNPIMKEIEKFKIELEKNEKIKVVYEPEFWTSQQAKKITGENKMHDASSAALILQSYLDRKTSMI
jgi:putative Holliday junction resolvase